MLNVLTQVRTVLRNKGRIRLERGIHTHETDLARRKEVNDIEIQLAHPSQHTRWKEEARIVVVIKCTLDTREPDDVFVFLELERRLARTDRAGRTKNIHFM